MRNADQTRSAWKSFMTRRLIRVIGAWHASHEYGKTQKHSVVTGVDFLLRPVWHAVQHTARSLNHDGVVRGIRHSDVWVGDRGSASHRDDLGSDRCGSGQSIALLFWRVLF